MSLLQMVRDMAPPRNFNSDLRPEVMPERTYNLPCLTDHWTHCVAQLCMLNVSVNGDVPATHLLVPVATQTTREMPPNSSERLHKTCGS